MENQTEKKMENEMETGIIASLQKNSNRSRCAGAETASVKRIVPR